MKRLLFAVLAMAGAVAQADGMIPMLDCTVAHETYIITGKMGQVYLDEKTAPKISILLNEDSAPAEILHVVTPANVPGETTLFMAEFAKSEYVIPGSKKTKLMGLPNAVLENYVAPEVLCVKNENGDAGELYLEKVVTYNTAKDSKGKTLKDPKTGKDKLVKSVRWEGDFSALGVRSAMVCVAAQAPAKK